MKRPVFLATAFVALALAAVPAAAQSLCTSLASGLTFSAGLNGASVGFALAKIQQDAGAVYWFEYDASKGPTGGALRSVSKSGGAVTTLASGLGGVNDFALDDSSLYWTEFDIASGNGAVKKISKTGGAVTVLATGTPAGSTFDVFFPGGIALDTLYVYWGESVGGGAIRRVPKAGGTVVDLGRGQGFGPASIALDATDIYGVDASGGGNPTGLARRMPIAGGTVEVLASGLENAFSAVLDDSFLYWAELTAPNGKVAKVPKAGGAVTVLAQNLGDPHNVAIDSTFAYAASSPGVGPGTDPIFRVPKTGGTRTGIDCGPNGQGGTIPFGLSPIYVTVDDTFVYAVDTGSGGAGAGQIIKGPKAQLNLSIATNSNAFRTGNTLNVSISVLDTGTPETVDFYFGALLPDGDTVVFFTNLAFASGVGSLANPATLRPILAGVDLSTSFTFSQPAFFTHTWTGAEPSGTYRLFIAAVKPGALADNSIDPGDIVALGTAAVTFSP